MQVAPRSSRLEPPVGRELALGVTPSQRVDPTAGCTRSRVMPVWPCVAFAQSFFSFFRSLAQGPYPQTPSSRCCQAPFARSSRVGGTGHLDQCGGSGSLPTPPGGGCSALVVGGWVPAEFRDSNWSGRSLCRGLHTASRPRAWRTLDHFDVLHAGT